MFGQGIIINVQYFSKITQIEKLFLNKSKIVLNLATSYLLSFRVIRKL